MKEGTARDRKAPVTKCPCRNQDLSRLRQGLRIISFFSIQPKRIQAEPCAKSEAGGEAADPVVAGLLGPEVAKVQEKLFLFALQAVCQLLLQFLDSSGKLCCAAILGVCKGLGIERSEVKLLNDVIHRFPPPLHGAGRPLGAD